MELPLKIGVCRDEAAGSTNVFLEAARFGRATVEVAGNLSASTKKPPIAINCFLSSVDQCSYSCVHGIFT